MTVNEAAKELGLAPVTVRLQASAGRLKGEKHGRDWWFTKASVERYRARYLGKPGPKGKRKRQDRTGPSKLTDDT